MNSTESDDAAVRRAFDWIYYHIDEIGRDLRYNKYVGTEKQVKFALMMQSYWTATELAERISAYWAGDTNIAPKIQEQVDSLFKSLDQLKELGYWVAEMEKICHRQSLLGVIQSHKMP